MCSIATATLICLKRMFGQPTPSTITRIHKNTPTRALMPNSTKCPMPDCSSISAGGACGMQLWVVFALSIRVSGLPVTLVTAKANVCKQAKPHGLVKFRADRRSCKFFRPLASQPSRCFNSTDTTYSAPYTSCCSAILPISIDQ